MSSRFVSSEMAANVLGILERNPPPPGVGGIGMSREEVRAAARRMGMMPDESEVEEPKSAVADMDPKGLREHQVRLTLPAEFWDFIDAERAVGGWSRSRYITEFLNTWWKARIREEEKMGDGYDI